MRYKLVCAVAIIAAMSFAQTTRAQDFSNWGQFERWCLAQGGIPVKNPPRCYPKRHGPTAPAQSAQCKALDTRIAMTRRELAGITRYSRQWQQDADAWIKLGEKARTDALWTAASSSLDLISFRADHYLDSSIELKSESITRFENWYKSYGQALPTAERVRIGNQISQLKTRRDVLWFISYLKEYGLRIRGIAEPAQEGQATEAFAAATSGFLKEVLTLIKARPEAQLTVMATELGSDDLYGWGAYLVVKHRVSELTGLQERQLGNAKALTKLYISDIKKRRDLLADSCLK